ncbi:hypothetical protein DA2_2854 [Desulfovibrio sp. A2]|nr:hypothetical protein DA2_2854 [Desulfovibrio sp. A2]
MIAQPRIPVRWCEIVWRTDAMMSKSKTCEHAPETPAGG